MVVFAEDVGDDVVDVFNQVPFYMIPVVKLTTEHCHLLAGLDGSIDIDGWRDCRVEGCVIAGGYIN